MLELSIAVLFLVATHIVPSRSAVREGLIGAVGRRAYYAGHSLVSTAALALVIVAYRRADDGTWLWYPAFESRYLALAVMPVAIFLLVCRLTQSPSAMAGRGIYRITTTPGSLAVLLWSLVHLANVGETRTVVVFAGMAAIAAAALLRNAAIGVPCGVAGAVPFLRIATGRERLAPGEIGLWRPLVALGLTAVLVLLHPVVIGADPLAGIH